KDMVGCSLLWFCQICLGSLAGVLSIFLTSCLKAPCEQVFDPMNLGSHICSRNSRDFANRGCIEVFEIEQHDFTIQRLEAMNLLQKVSTLFKIEFVGSDESVKSAAVSCGRLLIEFVLTLAHIGDSRQFERFVTDFFVGQIY